MPLSPLAGHSASAHPLVDVAKLVTAYYTEQPDPATAEQRVAFGTSGHRGSAFARTFNERHILAIRRPSAATAQQRIDGPLFLGKDTHALSEPSLASALEVLAANGVDVMVDSAGGYTPTPAVSHAILTHNRRAYGGPRRRHRDHALAQSAGGRRLQVQPAERRTRRHGTTSWIETRPTNISRPTSPASSASSSTGRGARRPHIVTISVSRTSTISHGGRHGAVRAARLRIGADPMAARACSTGR